MKKYLYIGGFAFFGAILRYIIKNIALYNYREAVPINTVIINVTGSFVMALILTVSCEIKEIKEEVRLGITTGFLGAYTTFSTLCKDAFNLMTQGLYFSALSYLTVSIFLGLSAAYFGVVVAREYVSKFIVVENHDESKKDAV